MCRFVLWALAFTAGVAVVAAIFAFVVGRPGDLQQRDLYPPLFLDRVIEHTVYPLWSPRGTLNIAGTGRLPLTALLVGAARALDLDGATYARLIVLWIAFFGYASAFLSFALFARWQPSRSPPAVALGAMTCGVVFVANPWTLARLEHSWLLAQWAAMPLVLGLFAEGTRCRHRRWLVASAVVMGLLGSVQPHYLVYTTLLVLAWSAAAWLSKTRTLRSTLLDLTAWSGALASVGAYFIAPYVAIRLLGGDPDPAYTLMDQTRTTLARHQDLPNTLFGSANVNWHDAVVPAGPQRLGWELAAWVVALVPLFAAALTPVRRPAIFFAGTGYAAALLAAGSNWTLTADAYQQAVNTVPGLWVFREPDRVIGVVVWSQALGIGALLTALAGHRLAVRPRPWKGAFRIGAGAYLLAAVGVHAVPAAGVLWDTSQPNYVPTPLPPDYRAVLSAVDADAGPSGATLVISSDERTPVWDSTRILRLMEAQSLANPSLTGDTRSPAPPSSVPGRWFEYLAAAPASELIAAARASGFSHLLVVRDYSRDGDPVEALSKEPLVYPIAEGPNLWSARIQPEAAPPVAAAHPVAVAALDGPVAEGEAAVLANHAPGIDLPAGRQLPAASTDARIDLAFGQLEPGRLLPVTPWFEFHGRTERWVRGSVYADERQSWQKELSRLDLASWGADYGLGLAFAPPGDVPEQLVITLDREPEGGVWLRVFHSPESRWVEVRAGARLHRVNTQAAESGWRWIELEGVQHRELLVAPGPGLEAVNAVALPPSGWAPGNARPLGPLVTPSIRWERRSATEYIAHLDGGSGLAFVVLREAFDPVWQVSGAKAEFGPLLTDGVWNGYLIEVAGPTTIRFEYAAARWYDVGIGVSAGTLAALILVPSGVSVMRHWRRRLSAV